MIFPDFFCGGGGWWILVPRPWIKPVPSALEGEVLTAGPPGKSLKEINFQMPLSLLPKGQMGKRVDGDDDTMG